jgi:type II secretory pathway pseudopilin PulG
MRRNAHTLTELVLVVLIMGVLAGIAIPRLQFRSVTQKKLAAAAYALAGDLRKTQSLALRDAATNDKGYRLEMVDPSPFFQYYIADDKDDQEVSRKDIDPSLTVTTISGDKFVFDPYGTMTSGGNSQIKLAADGKSYTITFVTATGAVLCTKN